MQKNTLIQLIVIYMGVSSIFAGITYLVPAISSAFAHLLIEHSTTYFEAIYLIAFVLFAVVGFVVIIKSGQISIYLSERSGLDDSLKIHTKPSQLLSIFIVILAMGHLLDYLPKIVHDFYLMLLGAGGSKAYANAASTQEQPQLFSNGLQILFACLMIIFCRPLTVYFSKNILTGDDDIVAEHETITIETPED